ncbi:MAG: hypothetical protein ACKVU1_10945 [bacterium]
MKVPRVNPVGVVEYPKGYVRVRSTLPAPARIVAWVALIAFAVVGVVTTVASVGRYCLTSDAGDTAELPRR